MMASDDQPDHGRNGYVGVGRFVRSFRLLAVLAGLVEVALALAAGYSVPGRTLLALSAAVWFALASIMQFRAFALRGRRLAVALGAGLALMFLATTVLQVTIPPDHPQFPAVKKMDVQAAQTSATDSCSDYARSVLAVAELPGDATGQQRDHAKQVAAALRAQSVSNARKAAALDTHWRPLYLAAWRINERWRGNASIRDGMYRAAVKAMHSLCPPF